MKRIFLMMLVLFCGGCAATVKQTATMPEVPKASEAPQEKKGLNIIDGCVTDNRDKSGRVTIEIKCRERRFVNVVVSLRSDTQYLVLIGELSEIRKSSPEGVIILENPEAQDIVLIPEMTDDEMETSPPTHKAAADKTSPSQNAVDGKGGE